jgi:hypothetical protein
MEALSALCVFACGCVYVIVQHCLSSLYAQWGAADPRMHHVATHIPGVRVLRYRHLLHNTCLSARMGHATAPV